MSRKQKHPLFEDLSIDQIRELLPNDEWDCTEFEDRWDIRNIRVGLLKEGREQTTRGPRSPWIKSDFEVIFTSRNGERLVARAYAYEKGFEFEWDNHAQRFYLAKDRYGGKD